MRPANQRFDPGQCTGLEVDLGLINETERVRFERAAQLAPNPGALKTYVCHLVQESCPRRSSASRIAARWIGLASVSTILSPLASPMRPAASRTRRSKPLMITMRALQCS